MQLTKKKSTEFDFKKVEQTLIDENAFFDGLFSVLCLPQRPEDSEDEHEDKPHRKKIPQTQNATRAKSLFELQQRLETITSKKKLTYKEKMLKKGLKSRMKKKNKQDERNAQQKLIRAQKIHTKTEIKTEDKTAGKKPAKPVYNSEGKLVFSKFDFSELGSDKKHKTTEKDPKKLLQKLEEQKSKIARLEESGDVEKAVEIKEKTAWKNALAKAEGLKVRDDEGLLKKSVRKQEQLKRTSKKKWQARQEGVKKAQDEKQRKRTENIQKRKKEKKVGKLKKAAKRGKIIPGF